MKVDGLNGGLSVPGDLIDLAERMEATNSKLLVLDPLGAHLGSTLDTHRDAAVRQALAPLASHMDTLGAACVGIVHWSKAPTTQALDRVNGSRAFTAAARAMLAVAEDPDDELSRVLILAKSNLGRLDVPALRYRVEGRAVVTDDGSEISTSGIAWLGEAPGIGAADIFATSGDPEERDALRRRVKSLRTCSAGAGGCERCHEAGGRSRGEQANPGPGEEAARRRVAEAGRRWVGVVPARITPRSPAPTGWQCWQCWQCSA